MVTGLTKDDEILLALALAMAAWSLWTWRAGNGRTWSRRWWIGVSVLVAGYVLVVSGTRLVG